MRASSSSPDPEWLKPGGPERHVVSAWVATVLESIILAVLTGTAVSAAEPTRADLEAQFTRTVRPFVDTHCLSCHGREKPKAQFDLSPYASMDDAVRGHEHWALVLEKLNSGDMPPEEAKRQPTPEERAAVVSWIGAMRRHEAGRNAGDPGPVFARRLSNAEYDYTIRDLTGVDLRPAREFPVDPANQAGFDNSGESLTMSPGLLQKHLQAARRVTDHLVLTPDGFNFAPHPVLADTDRDKYCILRIVDFYRRQPTDYADYFLAAWRYRHRTSLGLGEAQLTDIARSAGISPGYLRAVWSALTESTDTVGPMARLRTLWEALPRPDGSQPDPARAGCAAMRDYVTGLRPKLAWKFDNLQLKGISSGGQCFILWKNRQYASHRRKLNPAALEIGGVPRPRPVPVKKGKGGNAPPADPPPPPAPDPDLFVPAAEADRAPYLASFERFCDLFPDAFYISERGRMHIDDPNDKGRLLSAGFHNMMGYFRDDAPLMELILDERGRRELDRLWREFDFIAFVPERQHVEFIFYERAESKSIKGPEFDFARSEDKDITSEAKIQKLAEVYLAMARESLRTNGGQAMVIDVIADHFEITSANIRAIQHARAAAEPAHLQALASFAARAYRRPLEPAERADLLRFYQELRKRDGLSHEDAIRDTVMSILLSPGFCYRVDLTGPEAAIPSANRPESADPSPMRWSPVAGHALASRLSYFLWSSLPDEELLARAASGELHRPEVLAAQARRMLRDPKIRALAVEFGGNWLDFRRFEEHNAVDRTRFPAFTDELRRAMFEEPVRFLTDAFQHPRSVLDLLYAKHTFVNAPLAAHYGLPWPGTNSPAGAADGWVRVDDADLYDRGGLLPMAVFQTKNAPGLRTSPVKRGYWMVRRVLGESIPPPPAVVPELPRDESKLGELTVRQVLAKHREDRSCAACHERFDSFGLVFENYGPVGERRQVDLGGRPVDTRAGFPDGRERAGLAGLRDYVRERRQDDFLDNLCRKLLAYALNRSLMLSDETTLRAMRSALETGGYRFAPLVEQIVTSPQFRMKRAAAVRATP